MSSATGPGGPDLRAGVPEAELADGGMIVGQADGEAVLLARRGGRTLAVATIFRGRDSLQAELAMEQGGSP